MPAGREGHQRKARALVVVAKAPRVGEVKTRLCPPLTLAQSSWLYECLLQDIVMKMAKYEPADLWIAFAPNGDHYFEDRFTGTATLLVQRGIDLGERLHHVFVDLSGLGYREIVITDSDSPTVPLSTIELAYQRLHDNRCKVVLGPSGDGGYYLVGLKTPERLLFEQISWSTAAVLGQTLHRASEMKMQAALLPQAYDIDVEADLLRFWSDLGRNPEMQNLAPRTAAFVASFLKTKASGTAGDGIPPERGA